MVGLEVDKSINIGFETTTFRWGESKADHITWHLNTYDTIINTTTTTIILMIIITAVYVKKKE